MLDNRRRVCEDEQADACLPSFERWALVLDRLAALASQELHDPVMLEVRGWADGDLDAVAQHKYGTYTDSEWKGREVLRYNPGEERFEVRYLETHTETGETEVLVDRVLERYPRPD